MSVDAGALADRTPWVVVNTQPHREHIAIENLKRQEFPAYCPMIRRRVKHARKVADVMRPLFPSYVFVQVDPGLHRWRPILSTMGVRTLVRCGERLSYLDHGFVETLQSRELDGAIVRPENPYRVGQQVKVSGGAFDGLVATIIEMDERDRLVVLMDLLSRPVKVKLDASGVSAI